MHVRMRVPISGARGDGAWPPAGGTMHVSEQEAHELQQAGLADIIPDDAGPEDHPAAREPEPEDEPEPDEPKTEQASRPIVAETATATSTRRTRPGAK